MMAARKLRSVTSGGYQPTPGPDQIRYPTRLEVVPLANAVTMVALAGFLLCAAAAVVSMDLFVGFFDPWFHGVSLPALVRPAARAFLPDVFVLGAVTFSATVWVATAATAALYNALLRR